MPRIARQARFTEAFPSWGIIINDGTNKANCLCRDCDQEVTFTTQSLNRLAKLGTHPTCKSLVCSPPVPKGPWTHLDTDLENKRLLIECEMCHTEYWHHKLNTSYFACFCQMKTKKVEATFYNEFWDAGYLTLREAHFDRELSSHKCDMMVITKGLEIFIEVDGVEHGSTVKREADEAFHELFRENRKETQFLVRIPDTLDPEALRVWVEDLENIGLNPVSRLIGTNLEENGPNPVFLEL